MKVDLLIKNGTVIDPARRLKEKADVAVNDGRIVDIPAGDVIPARIVDAEDCLVVPGIIDFHSHVYFQGNEFSLPADSSMLPQGVTTVVDAGTAGVSNYENFVRTAVNFNQMRVFSLLNVASSGQVAFYYDENINPDLFDEYSIMKLCEKYPALIKGLKIRMGRELTGQMGTSPLEAAIAIAGRVGISITVHVSDAPCGLDEIADMLRPGDVFCHVFQGRGNTIIGDDGKVLPAVKRARERGVIFDAANGKMNFSFKVAEAAFADNFFPDTISTDLTKMTCYGDYSFGMPYLMSKYLSMGVDLVDIIAACTSTPAEILGMTGKIGTFAPDSFGDVSIYKLKKRKTIFMDHIGESRSASELLIPQMTILDGHVVYSQIDFQ